VIFCILWASCVLLGAVSVSAGVGFQPDLRDTTRTVVSWYDQPDYVFSAALYPTTHKPLSPTLSYLPQVVGSDGENNTLTLNTRLYRGAELVPVTVDAEEFLQYRRKKYVASRFRRGFENQLRAQGSARRRQGINIGFNRLPKRFDRIFGEGGANLKITGYRRITFSGRSQWQDGAESDIFRQNKFPSLNMEQISRFDITGTIGSKITVSVSQDSQTDIPLANRIRRR
jgi:cell surface protein SprA